MRSLRRSKRGRRSALIDLVRVLARVGDAKASGALARRLGGKAPGLWGPSQRSSWPRRMSVRALSRGTKSVARASRSSVRQGQVPEAEGLIRRSSGAPRRARVASAAGSTCAGGAWVAWLSFFRPPRRSSHRGAPARGARRCCRRGASRRGAGATAHALIVHRVDKIREPAASQSEASGASRSTQPHLAATREARCA